MNKIHILVADDIFSNQLLIKSIIEDAGYPCKVVSNGQKLVDELKKQDYAAIFTDIEMPVMNGLETVRYIREDMQNTAIPIIAMTAHSRGEFMDKVKKAGFSDIITKPYSIEKFKEILARYTQTNTEE